MVTIIVLVTLALIAGIVFFQSRTGLKISGQNRLHQELLAVAGEQINIRADWMKNWFYNSAASSKQPLVFVKDPNPGGKPEFYSGGVYHHIDLDFTQPDVSSMAIDLLNKFNAQFNTATNYPPAWQNPDPRYAASSCGVGCGTFALGQNDAGITYRVWAEAQGIDGGGYCNPTSATTAVACIETVKDGADVSKALRIILHASANRGSTVDSGSNQLETKRTFWLVASEQQKETDALKTSKANECMACHLMIYGGFSMPGKSNLAPHSHHQNSMIVTGPGRFGANNLLSVYPHVDLPVLRNVDCSHPDHSPCQTTGGIDYVDLRYTDNPGLDPRGFFQDGDPFNGTMRFKSLEENVPSSELGLPPPLHEMTEAASRDDFRNPYDHKFRDSDDYALNHYFDLSADTRAMLEQAASYSYIKPQSSGSLTVLVDPGKNLNCGGSCIPSSRDPMVSPGTKEYFSTWIGPGKPDNTIELGFDTRDQWVVSSAGGGSGGGGGHFGNSGGGGGGGGGMQLVSRHTGVLNSSAGMGLTVPMAGMVITGAAIMCGIIYAMGDVVIANANIRTNDPGCPTKSATIIAGGNIYIEGDVTVDGYPNTKSAAGQPANGIEYTEAELGQSLFGLATDYNMIIGNFNSAQHYSMSGAVNDQASPFEGSSNPAYSDPTLNYLTNGYYNADYIASDGTKATSGLLHYDSTARTLRTNVDIRIAVNLHEAPTIRPATGSYWRDQNVVGQGLYPLGAQLDIDGRDAAGSAARWKANQSMYTGGWWQGADFLDWLKATSGVLDEHWYSEDTDGNGKNDSVALNPKSKDPAILWPDGSKENRGFVGNVSKVEAVLVAGTIFAHRRSRGGEFMDNNEADGHIQPYTGPFSEAYDRDDDGISYIGGVIARHNAYMFAPGTTAIYRNPNMNRLPLFTPIKRIMRAGELTVVP